MPGGDTSDRLVKQVARALRFDSRKCTLQLQDFLEVMPFM